MPFTQAYSPFDGGWLEQSKRPKITLCFCQLESGSWITGKVELVTWLRPRCGGSGESFYCGGDLGNQLIHLTNAVKQFNAINEDYKLAVEILNNIQFTKFYFEKQWGIKDLVNWLLASHIHFVTCHPHQGLFIDVDDITTSASSRLQLC